MSMNDREREDLPIKDDIEFHAFRNKTPHQVQLICSRAFMRSVHTVGRIWSRVHSCGYEVLEVRQTKVASSRS